MNSFLFFSEFSLSVKQNKTKRVYIFVRYLSCTSLDIYISTGFDRSDVTDTSRPSPCNSYVVFIHNHFETLETTLKYIITNFKQWLPRQRYHMSCYSSTKKKKFIFVLVPLLSHTVWEDRTSRIISCIYSAWTTWTFSGTSVNPAGSLPPHNQANLTNLLVSRESHLLGYTKSVDN